MADPPRSAPRPRRVPDPAKPRFYYKGDRLKPLRAFCQAARLGSVSRAAEALFLSQPAVTLQLQALERDLGTALFERVGRRLSLTREGAELYELARPLVEALCKHASTVFAEPIEASGTPLYTDARLFCERGIPAVLYGAGPRTVLESNAKRADEHIELEDLRRATKVVARALFDLLS